MRVKVRYRSATAAKRAEKELDKVVLDEDRDEYPPYERERAVLTLYNVSVNKISKKELQVNFLDAWPPEDVDIIDVDVRMSGASSLEMYF